MVSVFKVIVTIECDTLEQAGMVVAERVGFDEVLELDGVEFDYRITNGPIVEVVA